MSHVKSNKLEETLAPIRRRLLQWNEVKIKFGIMMTPSGNKLLTSKAAELQMSKSDLLDYLSRCLDDPAVEEAIIRQVKDWFISKSKKLLPYQKTHESKAHGSMAQNFHFEWSIVLTCKLGVPPPTHTPAQSRKSISPKHKRAAFYFNFAQL